MQSEEYSSEGSVEAAEDVDQLYDDWQSDSADDATKSLFCAQILPSVEQALDHDKRHYQFDLQQYIQKCGLGEYDVIRLINYIRSEVAQGQDPRNTLAQQLQGSQAEPAPWADDKYLQPALENDALLFYEYMEWEGETDGASAGVTREPASAENEVHILRQQNQQLRDMLDALKALALDRELLAEFGGQATDLSEVPGPLDTPDRDAGPSKGPDTGPSGSRVPCGSALYTGAQHGKPGATAASMRGSAAAGKLDQLYFESYSRLQMHHEMLADKPRTESYSTALLRNPALLRGRAVLDVGCGSGILSLLAARAGAAQVVGVDGSSVIAHLARDIATANGLGREAGGPIRIVCGKLEDLSAQQLGFTSHRTHTASPAALTAATTPACASVEPQSHAPQLHHNDGTSAADDAPVVDIIVSEWMGYGLLFESMLDTVLVARDRFLRSGGAVLPDLATIHVAGAALSPPGDDSAGFWHDVYGFNMQLLGDKIADQWRRRPSVARVTEEQLVTGTQTLQRFDLANMALHHADFTSAVDLTVQASQGLACFGQLRHGPLRLRKQSSDPVQLSAVVLWFDVEFSARFCAEQPVTLSTAPGQEPTHWEQLVLPLREPLQLLPGSSVKCLVSMARGSVHRTLDIALEVHCASGTAGGRSQAMSFQMGVEDED